MVICRSIVALLVEAPHVTGDALTQELYSPHLDVHQRMLILETLASAAQQLADPQLRLKAGHAPGAISGLQVTPSRRLPEADAANSAKVCSALCCMLHEHGPC